MLAVLYADYVFLRMAKAWEARRGRDPRGDCDETCMTGSRERVLSGMRPTGKLHLGNYLGALENWVELQDEYECFYFVANWHVLTTDPSGERRGPGRHDRDGARTGWAPASIPSGRRSSSSRWCPSTPSCTCCSPWSRRWRWLERVPTYKEMVEQLGIESPSYGLLGYPLLQSADILMYKAQLGAGGRRPGAPHRADPRGGAALQQHVEAGVPGAAGQAHRDPQGAGHGRAEDVASPTATPSICPTPPRRSRAKIKPMVTDPARKRRTDPGNPDICPVFDLHRIFTPDADREAAPTGCRTRRHRLPRLQGRAAPAHAAAAGRDPRAPRSATPRSPHEIVEILHEGSRARAGASPGETMDEVRAAVAT